MSIDHPHSGMPSIREQFKGRPVVKLYDGIKAAKFQREMSELSEQLASLGSKITKAQSKFANRPLI